MTDALVVPAQDTTTAWSGTGVAESIHDLAQALQGGSWLEVGLAGVGAALDVAATVVDPFGSLIAAGLGWLMDHLQPLKGWLEDLTGDAGAVAGFACDYLAGNTTDALKVHELATIARASALANSRPMFLHLKYYRLLQHIGIQSDFDGAAPGFEKTGYRSRAEYEKARRLDPVRVARLTAARSGCTVGEIKAIEAGLLS